MNVGGIILLVAVIVVCGFEFISFIFTLRKKRKEKKELVAKKNASEQLEALEKSDKEV